MYLCPFRACTYIQPKPRALPWAMYYRAFSPSIGQHPGYIGPGMKHNALKGQKVHSPGRCPGYIGSPTNALKGHKSIAQGNALGINALGINALGINALGINAQGINALGIKRQTLQTRKRGQEYPAPIGFIVP